MVETHPNAFRAEAHEARLEGTRLLALADRLETQADALEGIEAPVEADEPVKKPRAARKSRAKAKK